MTDKVSVTGLGSFLAPNINTVVLQRSAITGEFQIASIDGGFGHMKIKRPEITIDTNDDYVSYKLKEIAQKHVDTKAAMNKALYDIHLKRALENDKELKSVFIQDGYASFRDTEPPKAVRNPVQLDIDFSKPITRGIWERLSKLNNILDQVDTNKDNPVTVVSTPEPAKPAAPEVPNIFDNKKEINPFFYESMKRAGLKQMADSIKGRIENGDTDWAGAKGYIEHSELSKIIGDQKDDEFTKKALETSANFVSKKGGKVVRSDSKKPYNYVSRKVLREDFESAVIHYSHKYAKGKTKTYACWDSYLKDKVNYDNGKGVVPVLDGLQDVITSTAVPAVEVLFAKMVDDADYKTAKIKAEEAATIIRNDPEVKAAQANETKYTALISKAKEITTSLLTKVKGFIWKKKSE